MKNEIWSKQKIYAKFQINENDIVNYQITPLEYEANTTINNNFEVPLLTIDDPVQECY